LPLQGGWVYCGHVTQGGAALSIDMALALGYDISALQADYFSRENKVESCVDTFASVLLRAHCSGKTTLQ
jgi:hypothetical protein